MHQFFSSGTRFKGPGKHKYVKGFKSLQINNSKGLQLSITRAALLLPVKVEANKAERFYRRNLATTNASAKSGVYVQEQICFPTTNNLPTLCVCCST